jgi:tRNA (cytidine/uridine-2'-O-)-methyltransferase
MMRTTTAKHWPGASLGIVLIEPRIPQNLGAVARLGKCLGAPIYLVGDLGFDLGDRGVRRAGMDYVEDADVRHFLSYRALCASLGRDESDQPAYYLSSKATRLYTEVTYPEDCLLVFGSETTGLPEDWIRAHPDTSLLIPMHPEGRSLNLAVSVGIVAYEVMRQRYLPPNALSIDHHG